MNVIRRFLRACLALHADNFALHYWYIERWITVRMHGPLDPRVPAIQERVNHYEARMGVRGVKV